MQANPNDIFEGTSPYLWQESYITADVDRVIAAPADASAIIALDRHSGRLLYSRDVKGPRYCLGFGDDALYVASAEGVSLVTALQSTWPADPSA